MSESLLRETRRQLFFLFDHKRRVPNNLPGRSVPKAETREYNKRPAGAGAVNHPPAASRAPLHFKSAALLSELFALRQNLIDHWPWWRSIIFGADHAHALRAAGSSHETARMMAAKGVT
ncbi:hypothetical protein EVAR_81053_1 [Eumeta japonica]|uniref:Uncharacterized protein n=1 Tax=Eumeta variegata TaxID=151549 RepID=A0A4C1T8F7_EUMVA|nr:hypothetical protein EVAR_81053_1 [Eumeta japonica]